MSSGSGKKAIDKVVVGSGNVFADLGLPNAGELLAKAQIAFEISNIIRRENLTQVEAARRLGVDQPKISQLLHGKLAGFSLERLFHFLNSLGRDVTISIVTNEGAEAGKIHVSLMDA